MLAALDALGGRADAARPRTDYSYHMCVNGWCEKHFDEMAEVVERGINTFKHFMAYKGALMVNDDEMFASFQRCAALGALPLVHAENGDIVAALQQKYMSEGITGPEAHAYSRPPEVEGEADQPRHHDRRCGGRAASISSTPRASRRTRRSAARARRACASMASR